MKPGGAGEAGEMGGISGASVNVGVLNRKLVCSRLYFKGVSVEPQA